MKKLLLFLVLSSTFLFSANAGYVVRGINISVAYDDLKNYTLTFDGNNNPISAGSMFTTYAGGSLKNSIVIIPAYPFLLPIVFPLAYTSDYNFDIEVRDFHYVGHSHKYVLCGVSRQHKVHRLDKKLV